MRKALAYLAAAIVSMGAVGAWGCSANKALVKSQVDTAKASMAGIEEAESLSATPATIEDGGEGMIDSSNTSEGEETGFSIIKDESPDKTPSKKKKKVQ